MLNNHGIMRRARFVFREKIIMIFKAKNRQNVPYKLKFDHIKKYICYSFLINGFFHGKLQGTSSVSNKKGKELPISPKNVLSVAKKKNANLKYNIE